MQGGVQVKKAVVLDRQGASQVCYVRVTGVRDEQFVEFEFAVGDPTLYIELVLPFDQFARFCDRHQPEKLTAEQEAMVDYDRLKWRYGEPGNKDS